MTVQAPVLLPPLEPLELHSGMVFGNRRRPFDDAPAAPPSDPLQALDTVLLPALQRAPCLVAFSGGRDSSALLAVATDVARRHGLDDPIPLTMRFADHPRAQEDEWQEMMIRHLDLRDWRVLAVTSELDCLGAIGGPLLRRHGVYWPPNVHTVELWLREAAGGSLLTGNGGDEVFSPWVWRRAALLRHGGPRTRLRAMRRIAFSFAPERLRAGLSRSRHPLLLPWLAPEAQREVAARLAADDAIRCRTFADELERLLESRYLELANGIMNVLSRSASTLLSQPFYHPLVVRSVAAAAPRAGFASRTEAMRRFFGNLLPPPALERSTKAVFSEVFWGPATRGFAEAWDGDGLDRALVDAEALRREWTKPVPDIRSLSPLQAAWVASPGQA
jgi:hypothetical protein